MHHRLGYVAALATVLGVGMLTPSAQSAPQTPSLAGTGASAAIGTVATTPAAPARKRNKYRICDTWDGVWALRIDDGTGTINTGRMDVRVFHHERAVGDYSGITDGRLKGDLVDGDGDPKTCGKHWEGTFKDLSGQYRNKGKFTAHLYKENHNWHFYGKYKPCKLLCSWNDWGGSFLSEE